MSFKKSSASVSLIFCFLSILAITLLFTAYSSDDLVSYRVFFEPNGGQHEAGEYIVSGHTVYQPGDPKKAGSVFIGWFADAALTKPYNFYKRATKDLTIYAKWASLSSEGSGTGSGGTGSGSDGGSGTDTGSGSGGDSGSGTGGGTTDRGTAVVNFDSKGGSAVLPRTVHIGDALNMDPDEIPTRTGATFGGWYIDDGTPYVFSSDNTVTGDITLHAKWITIGSTGGTGGNEPPVIANYTVNFVISVCL